jgi:hypothetical protein
MVFLAICIAIFIVVTSEPSRKYITMELYNACKVGMTYSQVVQILGYEGEIVSETDLGFGSEYRTVIYVYYGRTTGANANFTFQGGKLFAKAQIGLD